MAFPDRTLRFGFVHGLSPTVRNLLIANIIVGTAQLFVGDFLLEHFALHPKQLSEEWKVWQLFSYMFMHGSFFHLFFNMFSLWMFGVDVELELGSTRFLKYYLFTGFSGGVLQVLLNWGDPTPVIGASAAVYGVLIAFSLLFPNRIVTLLLFFILPIQMKARTLAFIFVGISLVMGIQNTWGGAPDSVAHFAHLGGAVAGFLVLRGSFYVQHTRERVSRLQQQRLLKKQKQKQDKILEVRRRIDEILDRINEVGYLNISSEEKLYLKKAGEFLSKEDD